MFTALPRNTDREKARRLGEASIQCINKSSSLRVVEPINTAAKTEVHQYRRRTDSWLSLPLHEPFLAAVASTDKVSSGERIDAERAVGTESED